VLPYWLLFGVPAFGALFEKPGRKLAHRGERNLFLVAVLAASVLVGLRYRVGADWATYVDYLIRASYTELAEVPSSIDPGYVFLNWLASHWGYDVWLVNLMCAAIFASGLWAFAFVQPRPWLAFVIAVPYLVIVVAMGYTRQGVAIGLAMHGLAALGGRDKSNVKFVIWIVLAATFHKSAVLLIPIAALAEDRGRAWTVFWVGSASILAYFTLLESSVDALRTNYIDAQYDSGGAAIRVAMNAFPALLLLFYRKRFLFRVNEKATWMILAFLALLLVPALVLSPSSTAVDRLGLYLIPLQLMVFSRVPDSFAKSERQANFFALCVVVYSAGVQFVWLTFGTHAQYWLPYQLYPF
jgi:hypothetical protein